MATFGSGLSYTSGPPIRQPISFRGGTPITLQNLPAVLPAHTQYTPPPSPTVPSVGGGGAGGGGNNNVGTNFNPIGPPSYNPDVQPAIDLLGQQIGPATESEAAQEANINASKATQLQQAQTGFNAQTQSLQNAQEQARQQASQILQGIQGRYGGTTGEGSFASALLGQSTQQTMAGLQQKVAQIQDVARLAQQDIEERSTGQINAAKQWLQGTLASIRSNQATLQSHKADLAYAAMNQYQQYLEQVDMSKKNLLSSLAQQQQAAQLGLYGNLNQGQAAVGQGQNITNNLGVSGIGAEQTPQAFNQPGGTPGAVPGQARLPQTDEFGNPIPQQPLA